MDNHYSVIGLMSGTSLDGLDIAHCRFTKNEKWNWEIIECETIPYNDAWQDRLSKAHHLSGAQLCRLDAELAEFHSACVNTFIEKHGSQIDFISSHGHTIFHAPENHYTHQIANGATIAAITKVPVVSDFRTQDVALSGQGAPLVPGGEFILFEGYDGFLNLGGIANLSLRKSEQIMAFDICTCNMLLNACASLKGEGYDNMGQGASKGELLPNLLHQLNAHPYYSSLGPASIGKEFFEASVWPETIQWHSNVDDLLRTAVEHIAMMVSKRIPPGARILASGGGVMNPVLFDRIKQLSSAQIDEAGHTMTCFKEALVFAFLGVLRWRGENNCLAQITGSSRDHSAGAIYLP
jgi:anhydro-N-acetylmuramic acid kinase